MPRKPGNLKCLRLGFDANSSKASLKHKLVTKRMHE